MKEIMITEDGTVATENGTIGRLQVVKFADNQKLMKKAIWQIGLYRVN